MLKRIIVIVTSLLVMMSLNSCGTDVSLPTVVTGNNIVYSESMSVVCNGNVKEDGNATILERGICYVKGDGIPSTKDNVVPGGSGLGTFSCPFNLSLVGKYSYRAYATNKMGTAYGDVKTFIITAGGGGEGTNYTIDDFLGVYNYHGYNWDTKQYEQWDTVSIERATGGPNGADWVCVIGLHKKKFHVAFGEFDKDFQCIRLYGGLINGQSFYFTEDNEHILYFSAFYPVYILPSNDSAYYVTTGDGPDLCGEIWLTFGSDRKLHLSPPKKPDNYGHYSNSYCFAIFNYESNEYCGRFDLHKDISLSKRSKKSNNRQLPITSINKKSRIE